MKLEVGLGMLVWAWEELKGAAGMNMIKLYYINLSKINKNIFKNTLVSYSITFLHVVFETGSLTGAGAPRLNWLANELWAPSCLCLPSTGARDTHHLIQV